MVMKRCLERRFGRLFYSKLLSGGNQRKSKNTAVKTATSTASVIAGVILLSLQFQTQVTLASLRWWHKNGWCANSSESNMYVVQQDTQCGLNE